MTVRQTKFENMKSQARIHCQHSSMGRTETQDGLCADRSRGPRCKITCQSPRSARTDARAPLFNPQPCCLFPLIDSPSFRSLNRAGLSSQADNDLCPWESPERLQTTRLRAEATSGSFHLSKRCLLFCPWMLYSAITVSLKPAIMQEAVN